ncbi:hypothetical protein [Pseudonocardia parietis]|uniref:Uncharacterized protein n=1 Tax=Pseudonocardia parietis TaxID=570936 RepID=A0ABS4W3D7_9PSEU|nr:hypothetical protein [Pseudonocardia parietis]MBP2370694.1 hypothetical protein [Pseudonocardia parietis]
MNAPRDTTGPARPINTWRVCGRPVTDEPNSGCTCPGHGPSLRDAAAALHRLTTADTGSEQAAP